MNLGHELGQYFSERGNSLQTSLISSLFSFHGFTRKAFDYSGQEIDASSNCNPNNNFIGPPLFLKYKIPRVVEYLYKEIKLFKGENKLTN